MLPDVFDWAKEDVNAALPTFPREQSVNSREVVTLVQVVVQNTAVQLWLEAPSNIEATKDLHQDSDWDHFLS